MARQAEGIYGTAGSPVVSDISARNTVENAPVDEIAVVDSPCNVLSLVRDTPLEHRTTPARGTLQSLSHRAVQRAVDLGLSLTLLLLLAPVLLATALLVKADGPGPVIFRHTRVGRNGKAFTCLKFRTMEHNAEELLADLLGACGTMSVEWTMDQKIRKDPRVTPFGRFLRRFSIDELPQLWNVVRGEMSIVGPRPIVEAEAHRYDEHFETYCLVKPGITGLWQVSGRSDLDAEQSIRLDLYYVENWSLASDLAIIARTVKAVVAKEGAY
jgi:Undecaprenyl-phosphate galactose phosphotransferase WbaP